MATLAHEPRSGPRRRRSRFRAWLRRRLDRRARLVILALVALLAAFGLLASVLRDARGTPLDIAVTLWIQRLDHPLTIQLMVAVSAVGYWPWSDLILAIAVAAFIGVRWYREGLLLLATPGAFWLASLVKLAIDRPRPPSDLVQVFSRVGESSFPSGHVTGYVAFYGLVFALVYIRARPGWRRLAVLTLCAAMIALVGVSRIYLGHHWVSDVAGGYAFGAAYLLVLLEFYRWLTGLMRPSPPAPPRSPTSS
ncbi:MAG: phosphatase PAP2 family protein [Chloroflexi bacterium]|nr:phosphatase PAP2 family protein [Chloroflexota bacterium]